MFGNLTKQLWAELAKSDVQDKIKEFAIVPVIQQLVKQLMPYIIAICTLFIIIIILLIIVIYN